MSGGPKEDCAKGVEGKTHQNSSLISATLEDLSSNRREEEIA